MKIHLPASVFSLLVAALSVFSAVADDSAANTPSATPPGEDPKYTAAIEGRTKAILDVLDLQDGAKAAAMHDIIMAQWRALFAWHEANDAKRKELGRQEHSKDENLAAEAKKESEKIAASLKQVHDAYIGKLSDHLTPEQVEQVKDKMTYGKVQFTFTGYCNEYPDMNEEEKAKVLEFLKEARELAMDAGSSKEKSDIFNKYKGKINNYLSARGHVSISKKQKEKAAKEAAGTNGAASVR